MINEAGRLQRVAWQQEDWDYHMSWVQQLSAWQASLQGRLTAARHSGMGQRKFRDDGPLSMALCK